MIADVVNETYAYLQAQYDGQSLTALKPMLLALAGVESFRFSPAAGRVYSYEGIQETLAALNEKESIRKSKGVYYTPADVARFIVESSIKAVYGRLGPGGPQGPGLAGIPSEPFCLEKTVLDPTCGTGEFLLAALEAKLDLLDKHEKNVTEETVNKALSTIYGNDINRESTAISKIRLFLCVLRRYGPEKCRSAAGVLSRNFTHADFISQPPGFGRRFGLVIGNPPYVEDRKSGLELSKRYGNVYANALSNAARLLEKGGVLGFVIPLSYMSTPRMGAIRAELLEALPEQYIFSYADRPDCLFKSVHQKLCILVGKKQGPPRRVFTGNYQYWYKEERKTLFERPATVENRFAAGGYIPKLGTPEDVGIYKKVCGPAGIPLSALADGGSERVYVNMRAAFWIKAFRHPHTGSEYKAFPFSTADRAGYFSCLLNSSLFWWYWVCVSDCWHITNKELKGFHTPPVADFSITAKLADALEGRLEETKRYVGTKQTKYEYKHRACLEEIHAIDDYVNGLFGLTSAESAYIKDFAVRYRVSGGA